MADREELLRIAQEGARRSGGIKGTGGRTLDISKILPGISAEDWGVEGLGRNRALGGGGIPSSPSTQRYVFDQRMAQLPTPSYPSYYTGMTPSTPGPIKNYLKATGSHALSALYSLAIPISLAAGVIGDGVILANDWAFRNLKYGIGDAATTAESAARLREEIWGPNGDANIIRRLGNEMERVWDKRNRGAHEHYFGHGDTFAAIGLWQDKEITDIEWWGNRALAVTLDVITDPLNALTIAGKTAKAIQHGMSHGWGLNLFNNLTRHRITAQNLGLLNQLDNASAVAVKDFFNNPVHITDLVDDIVKVGDGSLGAAGKILQREGDDWIIDLGKHANVEATVTRTARAGAAGGRTEAERLMALRIAEEGAVRARNPATRARYEKLADELRGQSTKISATATQGGVNALGRQGLKLTIPQSLFDDLPDLLKTSVAFRGGLGKLKPAEYRRIAHAMREIGMDLKFRIAGQEGWKAAGVVTERMADEAMNFAFKLPGTGVLGRKITNPILRSLKIQELQGPIPIKLFSLENRFLGLPTRAAMRWLHKAFIGRGNRWTGGGRMKDIKKLARNPNTNPVMVHNYKGAVANAGRGAQMGRRTYQELDRYWKEWYQAAHAYPQLVGEKGGILVGQALGGDPAALGKIARIDAELAKSLEELMPWIRTTVNERAGIEWLGKAANYRPRPLSEQAKAFFQKRGTGPKKGHRPYQPAGFEKGRQYGTAEEIAGLVDVEIASAAAKGISLTRDEAGAIVAKTGKMDEIFGHKLYEPGSARPDGSFAKDVETQVKEIMGEMGMNYSLFEENAWKFMPEYIRGVSARTGEVFTERLMLEQGIFVDRMLQLKHVPSQKAMKAWREVYKSQAALRRIAGQLDDSLREQASAVGDQKAMLDSQIDELNRVAKQGKAHHDTIEAAAEKKFDEALAAETRAQQSTDDLATLKNDFIDATEGMGIEDAVQQQMLKNDLDDKIIRVFGENNFLKHNLTSLRSATYSRLLFEDAFLSRYGSMEVFTDLEKFAKNIEVPVGHGGERYWDGSSEVIWNWVRDNQGVIETVNTFPDFEMIGDGLFRLKLGGIWHDQDQVYGLLRGGDEILEQLDSTPLGSWIAVDQEAQGLFFSNDHFQLKRLEQMRRRLTDETAKPSALISEYLDAGGSAKWAGEVPTPEAVTAARETIKTHFEAAYADSLANNTLFAQAYESAMTDPNIRRAVHTYYQVYGDDIIRTTSFTSMDDIESFTTQIETALRERSAEIEEALAGFNSVTFDVVERHGTTLRYSLPEYARLKSFDTGHLEVMATRGMPFKNMDTPVDNILAAKMVAANNSGEAGVIGGSNTGGRYIVRTNSGVKEYYVKRLGIHPDSDPTWLATAGDVSERRAFSEVLANAMYRELGFAAPISYASKSRDGFWYVVAPWVDDLKQIGVDYTGGSMFHPVAKAQGAYVDRTQGIPRILYDPPDIHPSLVSTHSGAERIANVVGDGFLADAFLANWDVAGLNIENIAFTPEGALFRVDGGGAFNFRAQGLPKTTFGFKWRRPGESISGLFDAQKSAQYSPMARMWRDTQPDVVQSLIGQYRQLDQVRMDYGGWKNFVRRHLPDGTSDDAMGEFVEFLEVRHQELAKGLAQEYTEGAALAKARIHQKGASAQVADDLIGGTYGPFQALSKEHGYPAWLSPEHDGISESQAIDWFNIEEALGHVAQGRKLGNASEVAIARDEELLRQLKTFVDDEFDMHYDAVSGEWAYDDMYPDAPWQDPVRETMDDPFANPWTGDGDVYYWGDQPMAADARFGVIVVDEQGRPLMRMPTAADGTGGDPFGGVLWTFAKGGPKPGETPYAAAVRETLEETGLSVEGFAQIAEPLKGGTSTNYYYIGRIKPGTTRPSVIAERQLVDEEAAHGMAQFIHSDGHPSYGPSGERTFFSQDASSNLIIGGQSDSWFDTWSTNFTGITDNYAMGVGSQSFYPIQVNLGTASDQIIAYGLPAASKAEVSQFIASQRLVEDAAGQSRLIDDAAENLDSFLQGAVGGNMREVAGSHMGMDFMTRVYEFDRATYDHLLHMWRTGGMGREVKAAAVLDFVEDFKYLGISDLDDMPLMHRVGFLDFLTDKGVIGDVAHGGANNYKRLPYERIGPGGAGKRARDGSLKITVVDAQGGVTPPKSGGLDVEIPTFIGSIDEAEMSGFVAEYLARFDEGHTYAQRWQAEIKGPMGGGEWGQAVVGAQKSARTWDTIQPIQALDRTSQVAITERLFELEQVMEGGLFGRIRPLEEAGTPLAKNVDEILDLIEAAPAWSGAAKFDRAVTRRQLEAFLTDRRLVAKAFNVYKRSLTGDGINLAMWYNNADSVPSWVGRKGQGFTNALVVNPHAVRAMPRAAVKGRVRISGKIVPEEQFAPDGGGFVRSTDRHPAPATDAKAIAALQKEYDEAVEELAYWKGDFSDVPEEYADNFSRAEVKWNIENQEAAIAHLQNAIERQKAPVGRTKAEGGVLDSLKFMDEYERAVMDAGIGGRMPVDDPLRLAMEAKIEMAIEGEKFFWERAHTLRAELDQLTEAMETAATHAEAVAVTKTQRSQMNALKKSFDKRLKLIDTGEASLARLGTVDQYGRAIPMENLPDEVRNLRLAVDALEDADGRGFAAAIDELKDGAEAAKWLRQVGEYGDDTIYFPINKKFLQAQGERYEMLDEAFQSGFSAFGIKSQGPTEIVESMMAVDRFYAQGGFATFLKHYDKLHNLLKGYMIMKPGFHMRNYFSAVFMNYLDGVKVGSYRRFQNAYWTNEYDKAVAAGMKVRAENMKKAMKVRGVRAPSAEDMDIIRRLDADGLVGGAQGQIGTEQVMASETGSTFGAKLAQAVNPLSSRNAPLRLSRSAGIGTETFVRGTMAFDSLARGDLVSEAFERVMKFHFDYSDLSRFEAQGIKRLVPFYTWTRKNLPLMIEQVGKRPGTFNKYNILKANIENASKDMEGWDAPVPPWMVRQAGIRLPFKYDGEFMHILPDLPLKTPLEMLGPLTQPGDTPAERIEGALQVLTTQLTPFVKTPIEWTTRRNMWKGYNFDGRFDEVPTVYAKVPLLMPLLQSVGLSHKNEAGIWLMRDYDMHSMASLLPTFADARRLLPTEERYQQRTLSTWMSFVFGLGLRTNTKDEQQRTKQSIMYELREQRSQQRRRQRAGLTP